MATDFRLAVYINGQRFIPRSVTYSAQTGGFGRFAVDVPGVKEWKILPPRSHAAVFFSDPVTKTWRFLCEGEYMGYSQSKTGEGVRGMSLHFEGLHACWRHITHANLASTFAPGAASEQGDATLQLQLQARANGQQLIAPADIPPELRPPLYLNDIIDDISTTATRISAFLPILIERLVQQTPVDVFYMYARRWLRKIFSLPDEEIGSVIDQQVGKDIFKNGFNAFGLGANTPLAQIISGYESLAYYQHVPLPSPPTYGKVGQISEQLIPELLFIPHLYHTVPPACNVIFKDQIASHQVNRMFREEPTRVITVLQTDVANVSIPKYYMSNAAGGADVVRSLSNPEMHPGIGVTHDLLSLEELQKGVIGRVVPLGIEKISDPQQKDATNPDPATFDVYMDQATRHHFEVERGRAYAQSLTLSFQPYIAPGFSCLIEDPSGPYFALITGVQHQMSAENAPSTVVEVAFSRDAYILEGRNRTPYTPRWLNAAYQVQEVGETYQKIFGPNLQGLHAAMVPDAQLVSDLERLSSDLTGYLGDVRPDLDQLASRVVPTPKYTQDGQLLNRGTRAVAAGEGSERSTTTGVSTTADKLRSSGADVQTQMLRFQYRSGTSLSDYVRFHELRPTRTSEDIDSALQEPPEELVAESGARGDRLFGNPYGMQYVGREQLDTANAASDVLERPQPAEDAYGLYELVPGAAGLISDERQRLARTIRRAIEAGASEG